MLKTYMDFEVLEDFLASTPENLVAGDQNKINLWFKYLNFLRSGSNLVLTNYKEGHTSNLINQFVSGRGNSRFSITGEKKTFYRGKVPAKYGFQDTFFLNETDQQTQQSYRKNNSNYFGFISDHFEAFERLSLSGNVTSLPVGRRKDSREFNSWNMLNDYLLPFSDCIIIDNYIFNARDAVIAQNLEKMLVRLDNSTPTKYDLLIITYRGKKKEIMLKDVKPIVDHIVSRNSLKANVSLIVSDNFEHDRNIFMNYLQINAGYGFNLFDHNGDPKFNTQINFIPYTDPANFYNAQAILEDISPRVEEIKNSGNPDEFSGSCKNGLLM